MILTSGRLEVEVAPAGTRYRGARFDWTAFVVQVVLDGRHRFCTSESLTSGVGSGGIGLCNEFGLDQPLGFDQAAPGEQFPKLGVGLLTRPDRAGADLMRAYPIAPFAISEQVNGARVRWTVEPACCRGYAARLHKTLELDDDTLRIGYRLDNCGEEAIRTTEYNHNFINIDGNAIGPEYQLTTSAQVAMAAGAHDVLGRPDGFSWPQGVGSFYARLQVPAQEQGFSWTLTHQPSRTSVSERLDRQPLVLALWGLPHVVSPELFIAIDCHAGESREWQREYRFSCR